MGALNRIYVSHIFSMYSPYACLFILLLCVGCTTPNQQTLTSYRSTTDLTKKLPLIETIVLLPPKLQIYEVSAGGIKEEVPIWSKTAGTNVVSGVTRWWKETQTSQLYLLSEERMKTETKENLQETQALYDVVNIAVLNHTYGKTEHLFPEHIADLNYSLGRKTGDLAPEADAFILIRGFDQEATQGRKVHQVAKSVISGVMTTVLSGDIIPSDVDPSITGLSAALVDAQTGKLLWYTLRYWRGSHNFSDSQAAYTLVREIFEKLPPDR